MSIKRALSEDKNWYFVDKYGRYLYHLEKPFMTDAGGSRSNDVEIDITPLLCGEESSLVARSDNSPVIPSSSEESSEANSARSDLPTTTAESSSSANVGQTSRNTQARDDGCQINAQNTAPKNIMEKVQAAIKGTVDDAKKLLNPSSQDEKSYYLLTLSANSSWINNSDRVFPVTIDPTIVAQQLPEFNAGTENRSQTTNSPSVELQYPELQPDNSTVGLWHFNSDSATEQKIFDSSGNGYSAWRAEADSFATHAGDPVWSTAGPLGHTAYTAMDFDGVDDYAEIGTGTLGTALNGAKAVTIEAWVNLDSLPGASARERIVNIFDATGTTGAALSIWNTTGQVEVAGRSVSTDGFQTARADFGKTGEWHHLAGVFDYPAALIYVYIDGRLALTQSVTFGNTAYTQGSPSGDEDTIGATADVSGDYIDAKIDEVAVHKRALSP